jgi:NADH-quinone oxidoreductase subunit L
MLNLTPLILLLPLAGFVALGLFGRFLPRGLIALIGCGVVAGALVAAVADFVSMLAQPAASRTSDLVFFNWVSSGSLRIDFGLLSDPLAAVMLLIVTGVGFLIHVYSIGYMSDDAGYWRFFSFLNLFVFAMALLVAADNFLFLLVGWAGVGLASFLLIGFWYARPSAVAAAKKAFVVNVIGDFGLMIAIFLIFRTYGTLSYGTVFSTQLSQVAPSIIRNGSGPNGPHPLFIVVDTATFLAIALLLFVAAAAKSAQLPLHVWLPDAMEGPTPVSALIHAATMVTAGVYLVARTHLIFAANPTSLAIVGAITGATALMAATIACVQTDIKRVLAYSTMSQLGYMFMGEAAGGFNTGIFHLTTHAYFKALLFMASGAVIHALAGEQDMRKMGGLRQRLPFTFWSFVAGGLALAAIFPFAGFWSKDAILGVILQRATSSGGAGWLVLYLVGLVTALLTGFYTFRLIFGVFLGTYRGDVIVPHGPETGLPAPALAGLSRRSAASRDDDPLEHVHEVGPAMLIPMGVLIVLSVIGGFYGTPFNNWIGDFLAPVTGSAPEPTGGLLWLGIVLSLAVALAGIALAWAFYGRRQASFAPSSDAFVRVVERRYYIDDAYDRAIVRPIVALGRWLRRDVEGVALDGGSRGLGGAVAGTSRGLRALQTGYVRNYALAIFLGAALIVLYYVIHP